MEPSPELQAKLHGLKEQFPDAWRLGELCAEQEFDNITGASEFRPQFDMFYEWEDTVPDTEEEISKFAQAVTPSAVQNIGIEMAKSGGSQIAIPNAVMQTAGLAFMTTFYALLSERARKLR